MHTRKRLVTIGGGSGQFALLSGLRDIEEIDITAVVSMVDSGGSTGRLRDELGILPPGDILKCILALSPHRDFARRILLKRFAGNSRLQGHNAGNMLLTMLSGYTESFPAAIAALSEIMDVRGRILPVTIDKATLVAELTDGTRIFGESAIDVPRGNQREKIRDVYLVPHHSDSIHVYPPVLEAIQQADHLILGPGDLFTSILPNLIIPGVKEAIQHARAQILYVLSLMTKFGETHNFVSMDFVVKLEECLQRRVDGVFYNDQRPPQELLARYQEQKSEFVRIDQTRNFWRDRKIFAADLLDVSGEVVRHDSRKLAALIMAAVEQRSGKDESSA